MSHQFFLKIVRLIIRQVKVDTGNVSLRVICTGSKTTILIYKPYVYMYLKIVTVITSENVKDPTLPITVKR